MFAFSPGVFTRLFRGFLCVEEVVLLGLLQLRPWVRLGLPEPPERRVT